MTTIKRHRKPRRRPANRSSEPPWVERPLFIALLHQLTGKRYIPWKKLEVEAEALAAKVRAHEVPWPPVSVTDANPFPYAPSAVANLDPMSPAVAAELPTLQRLFGMAVGRLAAGQGPEDPKAQQQFLGNLLTVYHQLLVWRQHSRHVLRVDRTLFEDFSHADPATIRGAELNLPVPALYVEFPRGVTMTDPIDEKKRLNVRGALIASEDEDGERYRHRELRVAIIGRRKRRWPTKVDPLVSFRIELGNGSLAKPRIFPENISALIQVPSEFPMRSEAKDDPSLMRREEAPNDIGIILIRLLDYLMSTPEDVRRRRGRAPSNSRGGRSADKLKNSATSTYWSVGRHHARSSQAGGWKQGTPLVYVVHVRAHYRNQAWGPGHSLRRRKKIHSHQRGPRHLGSAHTTIQRLTRPERD